MPLRLQLPAQDRLARSRLIKLLSMAQPLAQASLVTMARRCGKPGCKCAHGEKHVSLYLAARLGAARKLLYVPPDLEQAARRLVQNGKAAHELLDQMSQAQLQRFVQNKAQSSKGSHQ